MPKFHIWHSKSTGPVVSNPSESGPVQRFSRDESTPSTPSSQLKSLEISGPKPNRNVKRFLFVRKNLQLFKAFFFSTKAAFYKVLDLPKTIAHHPWFHCWRFVMRATTSTGSSKLVLSWAECCQVAPYDCAGLLHSCSKLQSSASPGELVDWHQRTF